MREQVLTTYAEAGVSSRVLRRYTSRVGDAVMAIATATGTSILLTSPAAADPAPTLKEAVVAARSSTQCPPLRYDPIVEHAAEIVNQSTDDYVSHKTRSVPADAATAALPILKDLGSGATKAWSLQGAGHNNDGDAIKAVLLEGSTPGVSTSLEITPGIFKPLEEAGPAAFANCSYTAFGVSLIHNATAGFSLATVVLAGT